MARVVVELPDTFTFRTELPLYVEHINYGNHLDNARLLGLVGEARVRWLASLGYTEGDAEGAGLILADAAVRYLSEAFLGETMVVELAVGDLGRSGFDIVWRMSDRATGREVARGKHGMVCFDYTARRVRPVPDAFRARIGG